MRMTTKRMISRARWGALAAALMMGTAFGQDAGITALGPDVGESTAQALERPVSMFGSALNVTSSDGGAGVASSVSGALLGDAGASSSAMPNAGPSAGNSDLDAGAVALPSTVGPNEGYGGSGASVPVAGTQAVAEDAGVPQDSALPYPAGSTVPVPAAGSALIEAPDGGPIDQSQEAPRPAGGSEQR